jgi:PAS domain S-box-containing protein
MRKTALKTTLLVRICIWMLVACPASLFAQAFTLERFNADNGLSQAFIYTLVQDEQGFLYVGTDSGLYQFSGQSFNRLSRANGLAEDFSTCSFRDKQNRLWFGHNEGGLSILNKSNRFQSLLDSQAINSRITGITEDSKGNIWVASQREGLVMLDAQLKVTHYPGPWKDQLIFSIVAMPNGELLLGTNEGLQVVRTSSKGPVIDRLVAAIPPTRIMTIASRPKRPGFWIGTEDEGLWEFTSGAGGRSDSVTHFGSEQGLPYNQITTILEDDNQRVWLGVPGNGFLTFDDRFSTDRMRRYQPLAPSDTLANELINCIHRDRFGQLWLGTYGQGLLCLSESNFTRIFLSGPQPTRQIRNILEDRAGNFWFSSPVGLHFVPRYTPEHFGYTYTIGKPMSLTPTRTWTSQDGLPPSEITCLYEDKDYRLWIGTRDDGVIILNSERDAFTPLPLTDQTLSKHINAITQDKKGQIWIATLDGAFNANPRTLQTAYYSNRNGLQHNNISSIFPDSKGRLWFVTHTNKLAVYEDNSFKSVQVISGDKVPTINCIAEDKAGKIWVGTDGMGLFVADGDTFISYEESDGLLSNYIYQVIPDRYGNIWMAHRKGFTRYVSKTGKFTSMRTRNLVQIEELSPVSAYIDRIGNIWFGSDQGAVRYNWIPSRNSNAPPYTFIRNMEIADYIGELKDGVELPYSSTYRIRFNFLGLIFLQQSEVRYRYKVEGYTPGWSDLQDEPHVTLQGLEDGEYTFLVEASNALGNFNDVPAKYTFRILPPFWKTWWFRLLIVLFAAGLVLGFVRYRTYRLNREKAELEAKVNIRTLELKLEKEKVEVANRELAKLSLVASNTDNAVFILDPAGLLIWVNDGFTRLTGYTYESLVAKYPSRSLIEFSSNPEIGNLLQRAQQGGKISEQYESMIPTPTGDNIWVLSTVTTVIDAEGKLQNIIIIDSNITERKKAEEQIRQMNTELERLVAARTEQLRKENTEHIKTAERLKVINRELDTFVYRASHDLKGPLASMLGLLNIATGELAGNATAERYLGLMDRAANRLDRILVDLIEATQVKQGVIEYAEITVKAFAQQCIENLNGRPNFDKVTFSLDIDPALKINTDKKLFQSIVQNYIDNTIKYRDPQKAPCTAHISIRQDGDQLLIAVKDNGIGVADDVRGRVFDMFFRGTKEATGSGLGLYIVQQSAEKLGGSVWLESIPGTGSTFFAALPKDPPIVARID